MVRSVCHKSTRQSPLIWTFAIPSPYPTFLEKLKEYSFLSSEDRESWAELCSRTAHLGEDADNRVRRRHQPADYASKSYV
ncbi:hypothetical protein RB195_006025 [Necator americanus]|uniref:Uncharacterized protein n=1 Tax=Necator americanus TaxID=51031 RepID=A0ABR1BU21_NECAM